MLEIFFCNVGDGDSILLREMRSGTAVYNVLVDCGRPFLEPKQGSLRKEAIYYLKARGVTHIDRMYLSHLHIDHIGGAQRILNEINTDRLLSLYLPPNDAGWVMPPFDSVDKTKNGLVQLLNVFHDVTRTAALRGCACEPVRPGMEILTDRLSVETILPREPVISLQARVFDALYQGGPVDGDEWFQAAKQRNESSVMLRFTYAGRSVLLTGDRFAADWENEAPLHCDVLKLPHHGDEKSMTAPLLNSMMPHYMVISCQNDPTDKKDRPNAGIVSLLQSTGGQVLCTENKPLPTKKAATYNGICITIEEDGTISCSTE